MGATRTWNPFRRIKPGRVWLLALAMLLFLQQVPGVSAQDPITVEFERADYNVLEGRNLSLTLTLASASSDSATFSITTTAVSATAGSDFTAGPHSVTVPAGQNSHTFNILIPPDEVIEDHETFTITIAAPPSGFTLGTKATATVQIVNVSYVPNNWSLNPGGLNDGDQFRLLFKTENERDARASNISDYDTFVRNRISGASTGHADIRDYAPTFRVVGSTASVDAAWHTATGIKVNNEPSHTPFSHAIYWLNGPKIADDYNDFWDGTWDDNSHGAHRNANGNASTNTRGPNTGTQTGTIHATAGTKKPNRALANSSGQTRWGGGDPDQNPIDQGDIPQGQNNVYIGLSGVFQVGALPTIGFDQVSYDANEGETVRVMLTASRAPASDVIVTVTPTAGTATSDDWSGALWTATLRSGETTVFVDI